MTTLGIDLGTTHTVLAEHGRAHTLSPGHPAPTLMPSVLAYPPSGESLVGWAAKARLAIDPAHTLCSTKRLIGAAPHSYRARRFAREHACSVVDCHGEAAISTRAGVMSPTRVAARMLSSAAARAGIAPDELTRTVLGVPAGFDADARRATVEAARLAHLRNVVLIEEPVATAVAYLERCSLRYALVYDLGGGTFDLALVDCRRYPFTVVAHTGDPYLGGDDVDWALASMVALEVRSTYSWDLQSERGVWGRLLRRCEEAKIALSSRAEYTFDLIDVDPAGPWISAPFTVTQTSLRSLTERLVRRTFGLVDEILDRGALRARDVDAVFLAGGSTMLPGLRGLLAEYFGKSARSGLNPLHVVAKGASYAAARSNLAGLLTAA